MHSTGHREAYLERVRTFSVSRWFNKPAIVSGQRCALYGWTCTGVDTLECCDGCGAHLRFTPSPALSNGARDRLAQRFLQELRTRHTHQCMWHDVSCPESFAALPNEATLLSALNERYREWQQVPQVPRLSARFLDAVVSANQQVPSAAQVPLSDVRLLLAIAGWRPQRSHVNKVRRTLALSLRDHSVNESATSQRSEGVIECAYCLRQCLLSRFHASDAADTAERINGDSSSGSSSESDDSESDSSQDESQVGSTQDKKKEKTIHVDTSVGNLHGMRDSPLPSSTGSFFHDQSEFMPRTSELEHSNFFCDDWGISPLLQQPPHAADDAENSDRHAAIQSDMQLDHEHIVGTKRRRHSHEADEDARKLEKRKIKRRRQRMDDSLESFEERRANMFVSTPNTSSSLHEAPKKRDFDPLREHRPTCVYCVDSGTNGTGFDQVMRLVLQRRMSAHTMTLSDQHLRLGVLENARRTLRLFLH
ncbi:MAG: hypothetical protein MHM6MM_003527 [Cercozoa sp. M6MM]